MITMTWHTLPKREYDLSLDWAWDIINEVFGYD